MNSDIFLGLTCTVKISEEKDVTFNEVWCVMLMCSLTYCAAIVLESCQKSSLSVESFKADRFCGIIRKGRK